MDKAKTNPLFKLIEKKAFEVMPESVRAIYSEKSDEFDVCTVIAHTHWIRPDFFLEDLKSFYSYVEKGIELGMITNVYGLTVAEMGRRLFEQDSGMVHIIVQFKDMDSKFDRVKRLGMSEEGGLLGLTSYKVVLDEGEFLMGVRISVAMVMNTVSDEREAKVQENLMNTIKEALDNLPPGTELLGVRGTSLVGMSYDFEVRLRNKGLKNVKIVEPHWMRMAERVDEYSIRQYNILTHIEYQDIKQQAVLPRFVRE